jgi:hypothetical protein
VDQDSLPIAGATVVPMRALGQALVRLDGTAPVKTSEDGSFELSVQAEVVALHIDAEGAGQGLLPYKSDSASSPQPTTYTVTQTLLPMLVVGDDGVLEGAACSPVLWLGDHQFGLPSQVSMRMDDWISFISKTLVKNLQPLSAQASATRRT